MAEDANHVCVFCGSSIGARTIYADASRRVGRALVDRGLGLVYGGGRVGLMGIVADAVLQAGGRVVGIIPRSLATKELAHDGISELIVVPGMHERKAVMAERSDSFLMLPGGIGTFEEFFEVWTWAALGLHSKPIGLLNVDGYFDPLIHLLDHAVTEQFVRVDDMRLLVVADDPEVVVDRLSSYRPVPQSARWIRPDET